MNSMDTKQINKIRKTNEKHELHNPIHNNKLFVACYISNYTDNVVDSDAFLGDDGIQAIGEAVNTLLTSIKQADSANQILDKALKSKNFDFKHTEQQIIRLLGKNEIAYIPFGSLLQKDLRKIRRKSLKHLTPYLNTYVNNTFGMFYLEKANENKVEHVFNIAKGTKKG